MNIIKNIIAALLLLLITCSFIEMFNENNTESILWFLWGTMTVSSLLAIVLLKSSTKPSES